VTPFTPVEWRVRTRTLSTAAHTLLMGILNVTPDSFSDGGRFSTVDEAVAAGRVLWDAGADIVDVGGESTRPGAHPVAVEEELDRVIPVVAALAGGGVVVSVDTSKAAVASAAIEAGAEIVNDVTSFGDPEMAEVCGALGAGVVVMHMQGTPRTMQVAPHYEDVVAEVAAFVEGRALVAREAGVDAERICVDPGIGFGKSFEHNLTLLANLERLVAGDHPVLLGASRKRFLGAILDDAGVEAALDGRDAATSATTAFAIKAGVAVVRVHNVPMALEVARTADAIVRAGAGNRNEEME
jgi:dihydropteroate synthase